MTPLDLIPNLKRVATTNGGEYAGACPFCGGRDRFRVWPEQETTGRFWCRGCGKAGDGIQLLRDRDGLSFREACARLGVNPSLTWKPGRPIRPTPTTWTPREATTPGTTWEEKAASFLAGCQNALWSDTGSECRAFLTGRGLEPETIERAGLGWNPGDRYESRDTWGLPAETDDKGKSKNVWLPRGLVIPCFDQGRVIRLRVRRPNPGAGNGPRYVTIPGSGTAPLTLGTGTAWVVVESELDAFLLGQEAGDLAGAVALGNAQARPDAETDRTLKAAGLLLIALDSDGAGAKEAWGFWKRTYLNAKRWPIPNAKDPSEAFQAGLDLRGWVLAGLPDEVAKGLNKPIATEPENSIFSNAESNKGPQKTPARGQGLGKVTPEKIQYRPIPEAWRGLDEGTIERLCIQTIDGGLSDGEAERRVLH